MGLLRALLDWIKATEAQPSPSLEETVLGPMTGAVYAIDANVQARLRPLAELGRGGMCSVHDTEDLQLWRHSALKVMHPHVAREEAMRSQFVIEARITAQLDHPSIIPIYEFGQDGEGTPYINMRKVSGGTLDALIAENASERLKPQTLKSAVRILIRVCEALSYAHSSGVIHRDVKPSNIMVGAYGEVYLMDWGIAACVPEMASREPVRATVETITEDPFAFAGSLAYMAPEQVKDGPDALGPWTDVFLLGATLYQVLTGVPPYRHTGTVREAIQRVAKADFAPLADEMAGQCVPNALLHVIERAMAPERDDRYASVNAMMQALQRYLEGGDLFAEEHYRAGDRIVSAGEHGDKAYIIVQGQCRVFVGDGGGERTLRLMNAGDVFGEMAILTDGQRTSSVEAVTDVVLDVVSNQVLTDALSDGSTAARFVRTLAERFVELEDKTKGVPR